MGKLIAPLIFGAAGAAILISLGVWQMQRLEWKQGVLAEIQARINDAPVAVPVQPDPEGDRFLPVAAQGELTGEYLRVLVSQKRVGAGYRIISAFETEGRRILVDRGFMPVQSDDTPAAQGQVAYVGNLHWPEEVDSYTPAPDLAQNLWFARDVPAMADALNTEPVLLIARAATPADAAIAPLPVSTEGIPNDHLNYAITWFSLAIVWLGMTAFLAWRIRREQTQKAT
ncbi:SURF1 family protein [Nereida sp. MMG025]|uniref:SURF1 family protein n=1 Tax=Nereida sp. MMG025 TaxID=2909981 RepID=UPI001F3067DC|nr:SURF1 family protein [Nereida sp. MMG025]MCF6445039.1 SURF1 family protein [Nereida sp. MMG025]